MQWLYLIFLHILISERALQWDIGSNYTVESSSINSLTKIIPSCIPIDPPINDLQLGLMETV